MYTIMFLLDERIQRSISWDTGLEPAMRYARDHMAIRKADRVEVWDDDGTVVFASRSERAMGDALRTL